MIIRSKFKDYTVKFEEDLSFFSALKKLPNSFFVIDRNVFKLYANLFNDIGAEQLYLIDATEENKVVQTALDICEIMTAIPAKRNAHLISVGGGIVQDITGFVANVLYRGILWTFVPTTLLAACDSCIGGKTSLNYKQFKNLLGTFYPPDSICICSAFFKTLTEKDFKSGLGEVVKFNIMRGLEGLSAIENDIDVLLSRNERTLDHYVNTSLEFKKAFIEEDEFDKGVRINLNFAHTFGHAFESISHYDIPHGTAVALGTLVANRVSNGRGMMQMEIVSRIEVLLSKIITINTVANLSDTSAMVNAMKKDKKQISTELTAVLMDKDLKLGVYHDVTNEEVKQAVEKVLSVVR